MGLPSDIVQWDHAALIMAFFLLLSISLILFSDWKTFFLLSTDFAKVRGERVKQFLLSEEVYQFRDQTL